MKSSNLIFICFPVLACVAWACGTSNPHTPQAGSGNSGGASVQSGSSSSGNVGSGASTGSGSGTLNGGSGGGTVSGSGVGASGGSGASGESSGSEGATGDASTSDAESQSPEFDGGANMIPAGYMGTPFTTTDTMLTTTNTIPGFIYMANYDNGGPAVAYCHSATATTAAACGNGIHLTDWCCSDCNATMTGARCDDRPQQLGMCPLYRSDADNAGLSHMNLGEVDTYAVNGPTWVAGTNGPTLTGPMVTVGTPVPQHANMTTQDDTYLSYTNTGEWQKYTVEVLSAGTYSIGALMGTPPNTMITFDFGGGITSGMLTLPASPVTPACNCIEAYHAWNSSMNIGSVTFTVAGTYVMTLTLNMGTYNPLYFTFTKQ
jgi:hypothetical protein